MSIMCAYPYWILFHEEALLKQTLFQHISAKSVFLSKAKHPKQTKRNLNGFMSGVLGEKEW